MSLIKISRFFKLSILCLTISGLSQSLSAQKSDELPFRELEDIEGNYTAGSVASRMVEGLGFRFYWATDGLTEKEIAIKFQEDIRSISETVDHIHEMSILIVNSVFDEKNAVSESLTFTDKRREVLLNLKRTADKLKNSTDEEIEGYSIKFNGRSVFPFYNLINGPIADAIWHCGQIVSLRRMAGNPFNSDVSVLRGKVKN